MKASEVMIEPSTSGTFDPTMPESRPPIGLVISIAIVVGTRKKPDWVTEAPNPQPVDAGVWTYWGIRMNALYMPKPSRSAAALVVETPRTRIIFMSTSGWGAVVSARTQTAPITTAATSRPTVLPEPQPQLDASLTARRRQTSQDESSAAPSQWIRPGARSDDWGM